MRIRLFGIFILLAGGAASAAPPAFTVEIEKIADSSTPLPNEPSLNFASFSNSNLYNSESGLVFANVNSAGFENPSLNGLYQFSETGIRTIAVTDEPPFKSGALFGQAYSDGGITIFRPLTTTPKSPASSVWIDDGENLTNLLPIGAELPNGAGPALDLRLPRISGSDVLFVGTDGLGRNRIYQTQASGGTIETVIDENTRPEFATAFLDIGDFQGDQFVFRSFDGLSGISNGVYAGDLDGNTVEIARQGDPVPNQPDNVFFRFAGGTDYPSMDNGRVAFVGQGSNIVEEVLDVRGVYTSSITDNTLEVVVDTTMQLPNDNGQTIGFGAPSISGDNVSFIGVGGDGRGKAVFVSMAGTIVDVIHVGDTLDGKVVDNVLGGSFALYRNTVAFTVQFEDFSRGLYMATIIPAPGAGAIVALGGVWGVRRRRR